MSPAEAVEAASFFGRTGSIGSLDLAKGYWQTPLCALVDDRAWRRRVRPSRALQDELREPGSCQARVRHVLTVPTKCV